MATYLKPDTAGYDADTIDEDIIAIIRMQMFALQSPEGSENERDALRHRNRYLAALSPRQRAYVASIGRTLAAAAIGD